jgi:signal transduction histidine kinase
MGPVDLSKIVDERLSLLKVSVTRRAVIETHLDQDLPATSVSAGQLRQIVMNHYKRIGCHRRQGWSDSGDHKSAGYGLGLAVVQGIVRSIGGAIDLASEPDKGTTAPATDRRPCHLSVAPFWSWKMRISAPGCCEDAP